MAIKTKLFTKILTPINTPTPLLIEADCGFSIFSIKGGVGCVATIEGTGSMCNMSSEPIPIIENEVYTIGNQQGFGDFTLTITAGSIKIIAQQ